MPRPRWYGKAALRPCCAVLAERLRGDRSMLDAARARAGLRRGALHHVVAEARAKTSRTARRAHARRAGRADTEHESMRMHAGVRVHAFLGSSVLA